MSDSATLTLPPQVIHLKDFHDQLLAEDPGYAALIAATGIDRAVAYTPAMIDHFNAIIDMTAAGDVLHVMTLNGAMLNPFSLAENLRPDVTEDFLMAAVCDNGLFLHGTAAGHFIDWDDVLYIIMLSETEVMLQVREAFQFVIEDAAFRMLLRKWVPAFTVSEQPLPVFAPEQA